jgi:hypothetical protein
MVRTLRPCNVPLEHNPEQPLASYIATAMVWLVGCIHGVLRCFRAGPGGSLAILGLADANNLVIQLFVPPHDGLEKLKKGSRFHG